MKKQEDSTAATQETVPLDQEVVLDQAMTHVEQNASLLRLDLESGNLRAALKHASTMLAELKTSDLAPKLYCVLCTCWPRSALCSHAHI